MENACWAGSGLSAKHEDQVALAGDTDRLFQLKSYLCVLGYVFVFLHVGGVGLNSSNIDFAKLVKRKVLSQLNLNIYICHHSTHFHTIWLIDIELMSYTPDKATCQVLPLVCNFNRDRAWKFVHYKICVIKSMKYTEKNN